jgi:hypothetical protein
MRGAIEAVWSHMFIELVRLCRDADKVAATEGRLASVRGDTELELAGQ